MAGVNYRRGDVVVCAPSGDYGKPRPAIVLQADLFNPTHASVTLCPITSHVIDAPLFRVKLKPDASNGLRKVSQAMADKVTTQRSERIGSVAGRISDADLERIETALRLWLGLGA